MLAVPGLGSMVALVGRSVGLSVVVLTSPWKVSLQFMSWLSGQVFLLLSFLGMHPVGFLPRRKV